MTEAPIQEYAGFKYRIIFQDAHGLVAVPLEGQHPAANKEKHRRAAVQTYMQENR